MKNLPHYLLAVAATISLFSAPAGAQLMGQRGMVGIVYDAPSRPDRPKEPTLTRQQEKWIRVWKQKVYSLGLDWDDEGNITQIRFSNHGVYKGDQPEKPGVDDEDMLGLLAFPHLKDIGWEKQRVGDKGTSLLKHFPQIEQVRFHYMAGWFRDNQQRDKIQADFMLVVDGYEKLKALELKHLFALDATSVHKFKHPFPALEYMELDCESAGPPAVHLVSLAPKLKGLELHRTTLSDEQFGKIVDLAPNLIYLELKPKGHRQGFVTGRSLRHLARLKNLQVLRLSHNGWKPLGFEDGLEHLVELKSLKSVWIPDSATTEADIEKLRKARPDLEIK
jgi:hypothetical protein